MASPMNTDDEATTPIRGSPLESSPGSSSKSEVSTVDSIASDKKTKALEKKAAQRKAAKELNMPAEGTVSKLKLSFTEAKQKREETKKKVKVETAEIRNAKKRLDRVKAKAQALSNNDLHEIYLMRMTESKAKQEKKKVAQAAPTPT